MVSYVFIVIIFFAFIITVQRNSDQERIISNLKKHIAIVSSEMEILMERNEQLRETVEELLKKEE